MHFSEHVPVVKRRMTVGPYHTSNNTVSHVWRMELSAI